ncbi:Glu-tRNA(Gln) amidotransferase subunit GatE [Methanococcoides methylutens]|uniref:Glutamyl-tRNA(Gln) amidotransferase subunit E n=1 Tax=Methanococcoides methylutens MM1 TaxID=1434104 RepID=A0A0E3SRB6_METMT|nr:Glu-tRNA(Gln) amidotransferase subunit GatE [Methanococcoides methylutens]AKB85421.1 Glutamyl-tRNA(Gln) amidotransferase transferase subunit [Methanococcoides methylutens MM1]
MSEKIDYRELGLKCGLEIHQQLDSKEKLFCKCPTKIRDTDESNFEFFRYLRPTASEMGETDRAALEQTKVNRKYIYKAYDTTCLVENDEEPPRELNQESLDIALSIAKLLHMIPVEQLHVMRKIVVDGSNTSGFQRTAFLAGGGHLDTSEGPVGVDVLCVEEEAAQKIEDQGDSIIYSLDRLGIPLVEIGTAPDIITPAHARETAANIGMLLRSTGKVKRGLGTIRQDVNISIAEGARVEIKGVQALDLIETIVEREAERQVNLLEIRRSLLERNASVHDEIFDVTDLFKGTESKVIKKALKKGKVLAVLLPGFAGHVGMEVQPGRRLGTEFSDRAKTSGVGGIFHTDELPNYGITEEEVTSLREFVGAKEDDAVVMVADKEKRARGAMESVLTRAQEALEFVPEETRRALPDGNSAYMRPLPGASRMYPETDVPQVEISKEYFEAVEIPELLTERAKRFSKDYGLNEELAEKIAYSQHLPLFEELMDRFSNDKTVTATLIVTTITGLVPELKRDGVDVANITDEHFKETFEIVSSGDVAKEGIEQILRHVAKKPKANIRDSLEELGLTAIDTSEIEAFIAKVVSERQEFVAEKGMGAVGPLMGVVMGEFRGKVDGKVLSELLKQKINEQINT